MSLTLPVSADRLRRVCDPQQFSFATTADLPDPPDIVGQQRAVDAIRFGIEMAHDGYNLIVLGPSGSGKHTVLEQFLKQRARTQPAPDGWCYVNNFAQPHKPRALRMPPGRASKLQRDMYQLVEELRLAIPASFESDAYRARAEQIDSEFATLQEKAFTTLGDDAAEQNVALVRTPLGFSLAPMHDGETFSEKEYQELAQERRSAFDTALAALQERLERLLRQVPVWQKERRERLRALNREVAMAAVAHLVDEVRQRYADLPHVLTYLDAVQLDVLDSVDEFRKGPDGDAAPGNESFSRYQVNVLLDHEGDAGAPVVFQDFPSYQNLIGRAEHRALLGTLVTDFTLIKPGDLHRANGGYLLLEVDKVLRQPFSWEGLKRALFKHEIRIESLAEMYSMVSTVSLEPEPVPLDVKVILFGERWLYYLLYELDPDFCELFKVPADFEDDLQRDGPSQMLYARLIASVARRQQLLPLDAGAVARVIEQQARHAGDAEKLSLHMRTLVDLLRESDYRARERGAAVVAREDVQRALDTQVARCDRVRSRLAEETLRGTLLIDSSGERPGQVNGLWVAEMGGFTFGHPARITARTHAGEGQVIDIQREAKLAGAVHSKAVLILSSFLTARYCGDQPVPLAASLTFEQTYGQVEGDSASVAELCALLSSLADVPVKQSLAVTGSVNQHGEVQAIGGVNEKIEGFFDLCRARGLTGEQGVIIPQANVKHLMLREDVVEAAAAGQFHIYAIATVDEAIGLLTGLPAGEADAQGNFPAQSVNARVCAKLAAFAEGRRALVLHPSYAFTTRKRWRSLPVGHTLAAAKPRGEGGRGSGGR
ncbi:Lon protease family protein [Paraburkholderia kururiensis]|uniref:Lon protease family protein n=1 Tax=Paraburkholderia kururiensis TaxID=984307 RepID=UPI000F85F887|nr:ATP-binding protein [Paraburkholderia kururiensis]